MSFEQKENITLVMKWILYGSLSIASFLMVSSYNEVRADIKEINQSTQSLKEKIIRIEYELKLRPDS